MLLKGKRIVVMGLRDHRSYAWDIGCALQAHGAEVVYTTERETLTRGLFRRAEVELTAPLHQVDVTVEETIQKGFEAIGAPLHGLVFSIAYMNPRTALGVQLDQAPMEDVLRGFHISALSLATVCKHAVPLMQAGGSIIAMSFDSTRSYPGYDWMGPAKAALEAMVRALQRDYGAKGIRVNAISAGPQRTMAAEGIPGFEQIATIAQRAPLGWDLDTDGAAVGDAAVFLMSDLARKVGGTVLYVDGGAHAMAV